MNLLWNYSSCFQLSQWNMILHTDIRIKTHRQEINRILQSSLLSIPEGGIGWKQRRQNSLSVFSYTSYFPIKFHNTKWHLWVPLFSNYIEWYVVLSAYIPNHMIPWFFSYNIFMGKIPFASIFAIFLELVATFLWWMILDFFHSRSLFSVNNMERQISYGPLTLIWNTLFPSTPSCFNPR